MWHPLRLAEDFAVADILTKGRVIFGVGRGYHTREVETFGAPMLDADANRSLFEEQVELILKAFREESFSHQGEHYQIPPPVPYRGYTLEKLSLVPRPINQPVEVWQPFVSPNPRGVNFMARNEIKPLIATVPDKVLRERMEMFQQAAADHGRELQLGEDAAIGYRFFIAETQEKAIEKARPYFEEGMKFGAPLGIMNMPPDQIKAIEKPRQDAGGCFANAGGRRRRTCLAVRPAGANRRTLEAGGAGLSGHRKSEPRLGDGNAPGVAQGATVHVR